MFVSLSRLRHKVITHSDKSLRYNGLTGSAIRSGSPRMLGREKFIEPPRAITSSHSGQPLTQERVVI
jgi:hypothetical protein